jgi:predicted nucleic acid-binding protein
VIDASAAVRLALGKAPGLHQRFAQTDVYAPDHFALEAATALWKYARVGVLSTTQAGSVLSDILDLRVEMIPTGPLAHLALVIGIEHGLTPYDAAYLGLADSMKVALLTADKQLAAAYERSELVS